MQEKVRIFSKEMKKTTNYLKSVTFPHTSLTDGRVYNQNMKSLIGDYDITVTVFKNKYLNIRQIDWGYLVTTEAIKNQTLS